MSLHDLILSFPWSRYSKKLAVRIDKLRCAGHFSIEEADARDVHLISGTAGRIEEQNFVKLFWLVDKSDGMIIDAKFQAFGQSALLGAAEVASELLIGKNYDQAQRVGTQLIDQQVQDRTGTAAFPQEASFHLNLVLEAIEQAAQQCLENQIPLAETYVAPPAPLGVGEITGNGYPGWLELSKERKIAVIEEVLDQDIRPYIALDAGGVQIVDLTEEFQLLIAYQGSCTSCYSSVGATLSYIQQTLRAKVHTSLRVVPQL